PSWANTQCWEVVVVRDPERKKALSELLVPERNPAKNAVATAPVVLAVCGRKGVSGFYKGQPVTEKGDWLMFDVALAVQNICLAAHALGLGTVIVGALDHAKASELLGLPEDMELVVLIPLGKPAHEPKAPPRKELSEFVHLERYGQKL
ncbi:nitroreductase, partial [Candidatus Bathyarchaeota archaeon]